MRIIIPAAVILIFAAGLYLLGRGRLFPEGKKDITFKQFWSLYHRGYVVRFERKQGVWYRGTLRNAYKKKGRGLIARINTPLERFYFNWETISNYDYEKDGYFYPRFYETVNEALIMLLDSKNLRAQPTAYRNLEYILTVLWMYGYPQEKDPFDDISHQERPAVFENLRLQALKYLRESPKNLIDVIAFLKTLTITKEQYQKYEESGYVGYLYEGRAMIIRALAFVPHDPAITDYCTSLISNYQHETYDILRMAIFTLGRQNDKTAIPFLMKLFEYHTLEKHYGHIDDALQFITSGSSIIPSSFFLYVKKWKKIVQTLPKTMEEWMAHDAHSVLWEKRLRIAHNCSRSKAYPEILQLLQQDEIPAIREIASR
ncbi:MAG: hypothetical protein GF384_07310 [Elusimicrobia bacterium]|nr:hypothetical protein [Elusimicrobiota bacterium]